MSIVPIDMVNPEWKHTQSTQKRIRIIKVNHKERHLDATDMEEGIPICLDADSKVKLEKIKKAKIYKATIKTYEAILTPELERELKEMALNDPHLWHSLQVIKESGSILRKYELIGINK